MACPSPLHLLIIFFFIFFFSLASPINCRLIPVPSPSLSYHGGPVLHGPLSLHLLWYGTFSDTQKAILTDFLSSFHSARSSSPSIPQWWKPISLYYSNPNSPSSPPSLLLGLQTTVSPSLSFGFSLNRTTFSLLLREALSSGALPTSSSSIYIILTARDVIVEEFCMSTCGFHAHMQVQEEKGKLQEEVVYMWVGEAGEQCPGVCAWPFAQPVFGPQEPGLAAPNRDVGMDGVVINVATLLAGVVTNPYRTGFFEGDSRVAMEAGSACTGTFGEGAYPGFPGRLLVSNTSGASYNVHGLNNRTYLLPALLNPLTSKCITLP